MIVRIIGRASNLIQRGFPHAREGSLIPANVASDGQLFGTPRERLVCADTSRTPPSVRSAAPGLGADTDAVLTEVGYTRTAIEALRAGGVI